MDVSVTNLECNIHQDKVFKEVLLHLELLPLVLLLGQEVDGEAAPLRAARLELAPVHVQVAGTEDTRTCSLCGFSI